jgi:hypothetical protein
MVPLLIACNTCKWNRLRYHVDDEGWRLGNPLGVAINIHVIGPHIDPQINLTGDQRIEIPTDRAGGLVGQVGSFRAIAELILDHTPTGGHRQIGNHLQRNIAGILNYCPEDERFPDGYRFCIRGNIVPLEGYAHIWKVKRRRNETGVCDDPSVGLGLPRISGQYIEKEGRRPGNAGGIAVGIRIITAYIYPQIDLSANLGG